MHIDSDQITLDQGDTIPWTAIEKLMVYNNRVIFEMAGGTTREVKGIPAREVDLLFKHYNRHLMRTRN